MDEEPISCSEAAVRYLRSSMRRHIGTQEGFYVLLLDAMHRPIGKPRMVGLGTANQVDVHPRDIFRDAIKRNAVAIIIAHNHPSGSVAESADDRALTRRVIRASKLLSMPVLDHIIITKVGHNSAADNGWLPTADESA